MASAESSFNSIAISILKPGCKLNDSFASFLPFHVISVLSALGARLIAPVRGILGKTWHLECAVFPGYLPQIFLQSRLWHKWW